MATIVLYAGTIQSMPRLLRNIQTATMDYQTELLKIRKQSLSVNQSICNLSEVIDSLQSSTKIQEEKIRSLETLEQKVEQFAGEVVRIDAEVAEFIRSQRQEFYNTYTYLKPESERNGWEHICAGLQTAGEFCKEHWKGIVTVVLVVAAVVVIILTAGAGAAALGPFLTILVGACKGLVMGAAIGGVMGGLSSMTYGGSFWEGLENGAFSGALTGMVFGGLGGICEVLGNSCQFLTKIGFLKNTGGALKATERFASATEALVPLAKASGAVAWGMFGFDVASVGAGAAFGKDNWLTTLNTELHQNALYNAYQTFISVLAVGSGGFLKGLSNPTCFVAGTVVLTATGFAAIETIAAGDRVVSTNPETGETTEKRVVETYVRKTMTLVHLTAGKETLHTTIDHPFYVKGRGFLPTAELAVGDILLDSHGEELPVENVEVELQKEPVTVYNFQVEDFHTYHVGKHGVLVHNAEYGNESGTVQTISNKFPNDNQAGREFDFTMEDGKVYIENGVQNVDFVIDMDGNLHIGRGHSYLTSGSSVQAAGTLKVNSQGYIRLITNESGHFQPTTVQAMKYPTVLRNAGLNVDNSWIKIGEFETSMSNYIIDLKLYYNGPIKNMH